MIASRSELITARNSTATNTMPAKEWSNQSSGRSETFGFSAYSAANRAARLLTEVMPGTCRVRSLSSANTDALPLRNAITSPGSASTGSTSAKLPANAIRPITSMARR